MPIIGKQALAAISTAVAGALVLPTLSSDAITVAAFSLSTDHRLIQRGFPFNAQGYSSQVRASRSNLGLGVDATAATEMESPPADFPTPDENGIYDVDSKEQHLALLAANPDKIVIMKFYAPWCRACKGLQPKFVQIVKDPKYDGLPLVFAQLSIQRNKDYVKSLGVMALPSIQIYAGAEGLVENFPCGPSKVPILKKKIAQIVNEKVDENTYELKPFCDDSGETVPCIERPITGTGDKTELSVGDVVVSEETMLFLRTEIPYFKDFTDEEFNGLMRKSKYATFEAGSVIMREGMPGRTFYIIDSGEVEISVKGAFEDPLTTPSGYLGSVVNRLSTKNYFGERSLMTGQPRAASIRAVEKTRCFTFDVDDIPESSVLSGKQRASAARLAQVDDKYGLDYYDINLINKQFKDANVANQERGSVNKPRPIRGVDIEDDVESYMDDMEWQQPASLNGNEDKLLSLLVRFKLLRHAARCFEYIMNTSVKWGDEHETYRRSMLVSKLTPGQREEFVDVFKLIDTSRDGKISVLELKRVLETIDDVHTDEEIHLMINKADPTVDGNTEISFNEFMGVMAEAEFYYLFKDAFSSLDKNNSGYVQAGKIDKLLSGLRDLISDDRMSIIDIEDKDMHIDYETFSRMMIGSF